MNKRIYIAYWHNIHNVIARRLFLYLDNRGYDVVMELSVLETGVISAKTQAHIESCSHFVTFFAPGIMKQQRSILSDNAQQPDLLLQEIEYALRMKRNIIPIWLNGFKMRDFEGNFRADLAAISQFHPIETTTQSWEATLPTLDSYFMQRCYGRLREFSAEEKSEIEATKQKILAMGSPDSTLIQADEFLQEGHARRRIDSDFEGALQSFQEATKLCPTFSLAYRELGSIYRILKRYPEAIEAYSEAMKGMPDDFSLYNQRGLCYARIPDYDKEQADYTEAIRLNPSYYQSYNNRGFSRYLHGDYQGAIDDANHALERNPNDYSTLDTRAQAHFALRQYGLALNDYRKAYSVNPERNEALAGLSITHYRLNREDQALRLWRNLVAKDERFKEPAWVAQQFMWQPALQEAATAVVHRLQATGVPTSD